MWQPERNCERYCSSEKLSSLEHRHSLLAFRKTRAKFVLPEYAAEDARVTKREEKKPNSRDLQREETRSRIFEVAIEEFLRVGVEKAGIDHICKAAGVARGTFYFHFPTKDDVLLERQRKLSARVAERLEKEVGSVRSVKNFFTRVAAVILEENEAIGDMALLREINAAIVRKGSTPKFAVEATPFGTMLVRRVAKLQESGLVRDDISAKEIADCFRLSIFGYLVGPHRSLSKLRPKVKVMIQLFSESIAA